MCVCPQYQQSDWNSEHYPDLAKSILLDFSSMQRTQHLKPHVLISYPELGLDTSTAMKTSLASRKRSKSKLSSRAAPIYVPSPMKGYSIPSLTPGSISTSSVRSSFTSLQRGRASTR